MHFLARKGYAVNSGYPLRKVISEIASHLSAIHDKYLVHIKAVGLKFHGSHGTYKLSGPPGGGKRSAHFSRDPGPAHQCSLVLIYIR